MKFVLAFVLMVSMMVVVTVAKSLDEMSDDEYFAWLNDYMANREWVIGSCDWEARRSASVGDAVRYELRVFLQMLT